MLLELMLAIALVESANNPLAIGDDGKAIGMLQIHKIVVDDVNRIYDSYYTYEDRYCPRKSKEIFELYVTYWGSYYSSKTGRELTHRIVCDIWNGGATAPIRKMTNDGLKRNLDTYWGKVRKVL